MWRSSQNSTVVFLNTNSLQKAVPAEMPEVVLVKSARLDGLYDDKEIPSIAAAARSGAAGATDGAKHQ
jgi:hypothetical protein